MNALYMENPCLSCVRVRNPEECENKNCQLWRKWFLSRWEQLRSYPRRQMDSPAEPVGVPLGGRKYAHPHQVRAYLQKDPCCSCRCTRDLCPTPCRARQNWASAHGGVRQ